MILLASKLAMIPVPATLRLIQPDAAASVLPLALFAFVLSIFSLRTSLAPVPDPGLEVGAP
jgi:hypothetical protein